MLEGSSALDAEEEEEEEEDAAPAAAEEDDAEKGEAAMTLENRCWARAVPARSSGLKSSGSIEDDARRDCDEMDSTSSAAPDAPQDGDSISSAVEGDDPRHCHRGTQRARVGPSPR